MIGMILVADQLERLDKFLARMMPDHSRTKLVRLIDAGEVLVNGKPAVKSSLMLEPGMDVALDEPEEAPSHDLTPADIPLDIIFEDEVMLIVNKPRGLASHPAASLKEPSLVNALLNRNIELSQAGGAFRPGIVHRLDKETTGLMVVAKTDAAHVSLAKQIESKDAERRYVAIVGGLVERDRFSIDAPMGRDKVNRMKMAIDPSGKRAITHIKRVGSYGPGTLIVVRLETGRTHQIRVHMSSFGMPVYGDALYAPKGFSEGLMQLHAAYLEVDHPTTGTRMSFFAEPDDSFHGKEAVTQSLLDPF